MRKRSLLEAARQTRRLTQETVARRAGTSQPTLSAYERGTKSPTLAVTERILRVLNFELGLYPRVMFRDLTIGPRTYTVPDQLWRVDIWPDIAPHLPTELRQRWGSLVEGLRDSWWTDNLRQAILNEAPSPASARSHKRAIRRLAERGLTPDEIRAVLTKQW